MGTPFTGKVAIVTGAAQGIGRAVAEQLADAGAVVALIDHHAQRLEATATALGGRATIRSFAVDVRDAAALEDAVARVHAEFGRIDLLFNNAGIGILGEARDHTLDDWRAVVDTNLYGIIHGITAVYPRMIAQGGGHIVNTGSMAGVVPVPANIAYVASKGGVLALTLALRAEAGLHGIGVTLVCPMAVSTTMLAEAKVLRLDRDAFARAVVGPSITAEVCARAMLRGVVRNRAIVRPHLARVLWWIHQYFPWVSAWMGRRYARVLARLRLGDDALPP